MTIFRCPGRWFAFCIFAWFVPSQGAAAEKTADELLTQAGVSFAKGRREEAIELATKAIEAEPKNNKAHNVRDRFYA